MIAPSCALLACFFSLAASERAIRRDRSEETQRQDIKAKDKVR